MAQRIQKQIIALPTIKPKLHLCKVGRKVLRANLVPRTDDAPLQQRERRLCRVRMNITIHVNPGRVLDRLMSDAVNAGFFDGQRIGGKIVQ